MSERTKVPPEVNCTTPCAYCRGHFERIRSKLAAAEAERDQLKARVDECGEQLRASSVALANGICDGYEVLLHKAALEKAERRIDAAAALLGDACDCWCSDERGCRGCLYDRVRKALTGSSGGQPHEEDCPDPYELRGVHVTRPEPGADE